jgi:hypothetical protein
VADKVFSVFMAHFSADRVRWVPFLVCRWRFQLCRKTPPPWFWALSCNSRTKTGTERKRENENGDRYDYGARFQSLILPFPPFSVQSSPGTPSGAMGLLGQGREARFPKIGRQEVANASRKAVSLMGRSRRPTE